MQSDTRSEVLKIVNDIIPEILKNCTTVHNYFVHGSRAMNYYLPSYKKLETADWDIKIIGAIDNVKGFMKYIKESLNHLIHYDISVTQNKNIFKMYLHIPHHDKDSSRTVAWSFMQIYLDADSVDKKVKIDKIWVQSVYDLKRTIDIDIESSLSYLSTKAKHKKEIFEEYILSSAYSEILPFLDDKQMTMKKVYEISSNIDAFLQTV